MPLYITLSAALLSVLLTQVTMIPLEDFYEFGAEHGDERVPPTDDGSSGEIQLSASFPFFDTDHNSLFVRLKIQYIYDILLGSYILYRVSHQSPDTTQYRTPSNHRTMLPY